MTNHEKFLEHVRSYVEANPDVAAYVASHVAAGLAADRARLMRRAADMETALALSLQRRWPKGGAGVILDKMKQWKDHSSLRLDGLIEQLEGETK